MQILCRPFNCFYKLLWTKKINWNVKRKEDMMEVTFLPLFGKTGTLRHHLFYFFLPLDFFLHCHCKTNSISAVLKLSPLFSW